MILCSLKETEANLKQSNKKDNFLSYLVDSIHEFLMIITHSNMLLPLCFRVHGSIPLNIQ